LKGKEGGESEMQVHRCLIVVESLLVDHMLINFKNGAVSFNLILLFGEAVAFIWKDHSTGTPFFFTAATMSSRV
jgi:hypothetical protein